MKLRLFTATIFAAFPSGAWRKRVAFCLALVMPAAAMTAIDIACGQDAALVANTHCANIRCEATKNGDLYLSAYFPSRFAATVGGETSFDTARECLKTLGCHGNGNPNDSPRSSRPRQWLEKLAS